MTAPIDRLRARRLAEFVDRSAEISLYQSVLDTGDPPIMVVSAESGMGKTSLLMRMVHECELRGIRKAEVKCTENLVFDYMTVMRRLRDELDPRGFAAFTDLINYYTDAGYQQCLDIDVGLQGGSVGTAGREKATSSSVHDVAGVVVRDNMSVVQRTDLPVPIDVRREQLTQRFLYGLASLSATERVVLFFDATEKMSDITHKWLWEQMLKPLIEGKLPNVRAVLLGQRPPTARDVGGFVAQVELKPLGEIDIYDYIANRTTGMVQLSDATRRELAKMLVGITRGRPTDVASAVDLYLASRDRLGTWNIV